MSFIVNEKYKWKGELVTLRSILRHAPGELPMLLVEGAGKSHFRVSAANLREVGITKESRDLSTSFQNVCSRAAQVRPGMRRKVILK